MTLSEASPAERHRAVAARFGSLVEATTDWTAPAPVDGWVARDVVDHLIEWFPALLATGSERSWPSGPPVSRDPVAAWAAQATGVQLLLDDSVAAAEPFVHQHIPRMPLAQMIDQFYTADVFMHSWDLARASRQEDHLDPGFAQDLLTGMQGMEELLRSSGQYGPAHPVPDDAPVQDRLVAFIGRDPAWGPPPRTA